ncbi:chromosomal replication initiator protein DnaA [Chloroflexota bacterium]
MGSRSPQEIWEAALGEIEVQISKPNYRTWFEKTAGLSYQDNKFVIGVPNTFIAEYLDKSQRSLIEKTLIGITHQGAKVIFQVDTKCQESLTSQGRREDSVRSPAPSLPKFNAKYTFDSFVVGDSNRLAQAAALGVAQTPGSNYNPLFIYGGPGLGKTHLLHAVGHTAMDRHLKVLYVSAEKFTNEFVTAIREKNTQEFRAKYRSVDMLLIDDIHFISGKEQTEESFFHTFNELHNANHQIVITSDTAPKAMPLIEERLRSRFEWGLIADIQPPDIETRLAILQAKVAQKQLEIAPEVLELIAQRVQKNVRELEGAINRVTAYANLIQSEPTPETAARALDDIAGKAPLANLITPILEAVADSFKLASSDLLGRRRDKETALARQLAMYLIRQECHLSLAAIGQEMGGRDSSTVIHACKKISNDLSTNPYVQRKVRDSQQRLSR